MRRGKGDEKEMKKNLSLSIQLKRFPVYVGLGFFGQKYVRGNLVFSEVSSRQR